MFSSIEQSAQRCARIGRVVYLAALVPAFVSELNFAMWLTFKGVNVQQWAH